MGGHKGPIQAAGAVVFRDVDGTEGAREVLVVHRPDYDDFSLPKGKVERGEDLPITAVREVAEETGIDIRLSMPLQPTEYTVKYSTASGKPKRRAKVVSWWLGVAVGGSIEEATASPEEIDGAFWMPTDQALEQLSYPTDVQVLEEALELPSTSTIILVRHGKAVSRKEWSSRKKKTATDAKRPLERRGRRQARALIDLLGAFGVSHLVSSSSTRCMQTLKPYAENIGADIVAIDALRGGSRGRFSQDRVRHEKNRWSCPLRPVTSSRGVRPPTSPTDHAGRPRWGESPHVNRRMPDRSPG